MVIILLADGFEELEALSPLDILLRAGVEAKTVGMNGKTVTGTHGIKVIADMLPDDVKLEKVEAVILPGGMPGAINLDKHPFTDVVIDKLINRGGRLAAICAAPLILGRRGLLRGKVATCFPGFENELTDAKVCDAPVVTDGNVTTAKSFEYAFAFGKELERLIKEKK